MEIWTSNTDEQEDEYFEKNYKDEPVDRKQSIKPIQKEKPTQQAEISRVSHEEEITALGGSYEVKSIPIKNQYKTQNKPQNVFTKTFDGISDSFDQKKFPIWLAGVIIAIPIIILFTLSAISAKNQKSKETDPFLFRTIESKYFTMSYPAEYTAQSSIDKKVPFLEKHTLTTPSGGDKTLSIMIKDVKFDYNLDENTAVRARRENSAIYKELPYTIQTKQGLYYQRLDGNYESMVVFIDRSKSLLYEIMFFSPSNFAQSSQLEAEFKNFLNNITLL